MAKNRKNKNQEPSTGGLYEGEEGAGTANAEPLQYVMDMLGKAGLWNTGNAELDAYIQGVLAPRLVQEYNTALAANRNLKMVDWFTQTYGAPGALENAAYTGYSGYRGQTEGTAQQAAFSAMFASGGDPTYQDWLQNDYYVQWQQKYEQARAANPALTWDQFVSQNQAAIQQGAASGYADYYSGTNPQGYYSGVTRGMTTGGNDPYYDAWLAEQQFATTQAAWEQAKLTNPGLSYGDFMRSPQGQALMERGGLYEGFTDYWSGDRPAEYFGAYMGNRGLGAGQGNLAWDQWVESQLLPSEMQRWQAQRLDTMQNPPPTTPPPGTTPPPFGGPRQDHGGKFPPGFGGGRPTGERGDPGSGGFGRPTGERGEPKPPLLGGRPPAEQRGTTTALLQQTAAPPPQQKPRSFAEMTTGARGGGPGTFAEFTTGQKPPSTLGGRLTTQPVNNNGLLPVGGAPPRTGGLGNILQPPVPGAPPASGPASFSDYLDDQNNQLTDWQKRFANRSSGLRTPTKTAGAGRWSWWD